MDGVYQQKDSYIVNGTTLTFDAAPANGSSIEVMSFAQTTINQPGSNTVSVAELNLSDGSSGQFITTDGNGTISFASVPAGYTDSDVETYLNTSEIYTDATNNRIGIGEATPDTKLHVKITGSGDAVKIEGNSITDFDFIGNPPEFNLEDTSSSTNAKRGRLTVDSGFIRIDGISDDDTTLNYSFFIGDLSNGKVGIGTSSPAVSLDVSSKTDAIKVPNGTDAQKPSGATGMIRYNSTNSKLEGYVGSNWENIKTTPQDLTQINGLQVWADVTGGISSTTVADLSGNNRTGTLQNTTNKGTLAGNTYIQAFGSNTLTYATGVLPNLPWSGSNACTFFFVCTNKRSNNTYATYLGSNSSAVNYQIIRHNGASVNYNVYAENLSNWQITASNAVPVNATISEAYILIMQFKAPSGNSQVEIFKRENGSTTSATHAIAGNTYSFELTDNNTTVTIGTSSWSNEHLDAGIFAWGATNTEMSSADRQIIYDYYADKGLAN